MCRCCLEGKLIICSRWPSSRRSSISPVPMAAQVKKLEKNFASAAAKPMPSPPNGCFHCLWKLVGRLARRALKILIMVTKGMFGVSP